jgi:hypothetical protein
MADKPKSKTLEYFDYFDFCDWAAEQISITSIEVQDAFINLNSGDGFSNDTHHVVALDVTNLASYLTDTERLHVIQVIDLIHTEYPTVDNQVAFWVCW